MSPAAQHDGELCSTLGYQFREPGVLEEALTHSSVERPHGQTRADYERLEFLGDRVLGLVVADMLLHMYPDSDAGGRRKPAILADVCEAVIGALYIDGGLEPAAAFIRGQWEPMAKKLARAPKDAKTALQEWAHARGLEGPTYAVLEQTGPDHDPVFTIEAILKGHKPEIGEGRSKRVAEQAAAEALLKRLEDGGATPREPVPE